VFQIQSSANEHAFYIPQKMAILLTFFLALLISLFFVPGYLGSKASMVPLVLFFFVLFMAGIASQYWLRPFGPRLWGVSWLPLVFVMLLFTFLFSAPSPYRQRKKVDEAGHIGTKEAAISLSVWLLLGLLLLAVLAGLFWTPLPAAMP
jgi:hypothetical protein